MKTQFHPSLTPRPSPNKRKTHHPSPNARASIIDLKVEEAPHAQNTWSTAAGAVAVCLAPGRPLGRVDVVVWSWRPGAARLRRAIATPIALPYAAAAMGTNRVVHSHGDIQARRNFDGRCATVAGRVRGSRLLQWRLRQFVERVIVLEHVWDIFILRRLRHVLYFFGKKNLSITTFYSKLLGPNNVGQNVLLLR